MKRAATGVLILLVCCAQGETPAPPRTPATTTHVTETAPAPPAPPRVWIASLLTRGGFRGGVLVVSVRSDGATLRCSPQQQAAVEQAVAAAHPEAWKKSYAPPAPTGLTDQFHYSFTLKADEKSYDVGWDTEGSGLLPADLQRLVAAMNAARGELGKRCR